MSEEKDNIKEKDSVKDNAKESKVEGLDVLTKAAETIAGDNKLLSTLLKIVLSPIGLIAALCGVGYLWWKNTTYKTKINELEKELQAERFTIKELEKEIKVLEESPRPINTNSYNIEEVQENIGHVPLRRVTNFNKRNINNKNIHLD